MYHKRVKYVPITTVEKIKKNEQNQSYNEIRIKDLIVCNDAVYWILTTLINR